MTLLKSAHVRGSLNASPQVRGLPLLAGICGDRFVQCHRNSVILNTGFRAA